MSISELTDYFLRYGAFFIYLIVLLEYLNLPGFPAGVIMPLAGIWAAKGEISFPMVMVLTVFAGLTGSWALYLLGRFGGFSGRFDTKAEYLWTQSRILGRWSTCISQDAGKGSESSVFFCAVIFKQTACGSGRSAWYPLF